MGWSLWSSTPSGTESTASSPSSSSSSPPQPAVSSIQTPPPRPNTYREDIISPSAAAAAAADVPESPPPRKLTRDELAEVELRAFLDEINASLTSTTPNASTTSTPQPTPTSPLHPTTQSCSTLFDSAFYCQSLGGQFMNVYRYGGIKDCSEHWGAFWFCMRNRSYGEEEKKQRVQEFYKEKEKRYLKGVGPSCEDIWTARTEGEKVVDAFNKDPETDDAGKRPVSG